MYEHKICDTWGRTTKEELHARGRMLDSIRLSFLSRPPYGDDTIRAAQAEFDAVVKAGTHLSDAYALLTEEQRRRLRESFDKPALRIVDPDGEERWLAAKLHVLDRLEGGVPIGPVDEPLVHRPAGTKAF